MTLTPGLSTARDLFEKLKRDAKALDAEVTCDRFFNFVVTGYSLIDWIRFNPSVPASAKTKAELDSLFKNHWLKICGDLATAGKHFLIDERKIKGRSNTSSADAIQGFDHGRFGKGSFGIGEQEIIIILDDKSTISGLDLIKNVLSTWEDFFKKHGF